MFAELADLPDLVVVLRVPLATIVYIEYLHELAHCGGGLVAMM